MLKQLLRQLIQRRDLSRGEVGAIFEAIFDGRASPEQVAALLIALRMKGETVDELTGAAEVVRGRAIRMRVPTGPILDTCGTGGDGTNTLNISTAAAFAASAAGATVAKHGNRHISSRCGSADVLSAAGVCVDVPIAVTERCLADLGIAFLSAPSFHPVMRAVARTRGELGVRSIFNLLGPLTNPAGASRQLIGVYDPALVPVVAGALAALGTERSLVVSGEDGLDEISPYGSTCAALVEDGQVTMIRLEPEDAGIERSALKDLEGGAPGENARELREVLGGKPGSYREAVVLNGGAALWIAGKSENLRAGAARVRRTLDDGSALAKLEALIAMTSGVFEPAAEGRRPL